jgi:ATP-binding protein involved in chromosome partitioning
MAAPESITVTPAQVLEALRRVKGPDLDSNIVDLGLVSDVLIKDAKAYFSITVDPARATELEPLRRAAETVVAAVAGVKSVTAVLTAEKAKGSVAAPAAKASPAMGTNTPEHPRVAAARAQGATGDGNKKTPAGPPPSLAPAAPAAKGAAAVTGVRHLVAVASGKGGVGKSTTAVNLALGFQALGLKVGILDADIFGPSQPRLLGLTGRPSVVPGTNTLRPMEAFGLQVMSMGFMVDEGTPVIFRGPMVRSALLQMLRDVAWGGANAPLDVLVIDMPPGTGDVQLTMAQEVPLSGAIIVSTPQDLALIDARKGLNMFRKVDVPVLGIIENMSYFLCPKCGERSEIFGHGGARQEAEKLGVPFLGGVPLHMDIRLKSDSGQPITATSPDGLHAGIYRDLAAAAWTEIQAAKGNAIVPPALELNAVKDSLRVTFDNGKTYDLSAEMLRVMSPSAEVQGHSPSQRVTVGKKRNVKIRELTPVGNYAVRITFDDGHNTGLFSWPYFEELGRDKEQRWAQYLKELAGKGLSRG